MAKNKFSWDAFYRMPVIGIIRGLRMEDIKNIIPIYQQSGLNTIEITMNTKAAGSIIEYIRTTFPDLNTGAGTVCSTTDIQHALNAGATFIVTPVVNKKVIRRCVKEKIPVFAGAFTPTEIYRAWSLGASMVKVYPARSLGSDYIKDIKAPLNKIKLLPTGGVGLEDIAALKKAGADGFGIGSPLFVKQLIEEKNWEALLEHFKRFVTKVQE